MSHVTHDTVDKIGKLGINTLATFIGISLLKWLSKQDFFSFSGLFSSRFQVPTWFHLVNEIKRRITTKCLK